MRSVSEADRSSISEPEVFDQREETEQFEFRKCYNIINAPINTMSAIQIDSIPPIYDYREPIRLYVKNDTLYFDNSDVMGFLHIKGPWVSIALPIGESVCGGITPQILSDYTKTYTSERSKYVPELITTANSIYERYCKEELHTSKPKVDNIGIITLSLGSINVYALPGKEKLELEDVFYSFRCLINIMTDRRSLSDMIALVSIDKALIQECEYANEFVSVISAANLRDFIKGDILVKSINDECKMLLERHNNTKEQSRVLAAVVSNVDILLKSMSELTTTVETLTNRVNQFETQAKPQSQTQTQPQMTHIGDIQFDLMAPISVYLDTNGKAYHSANHAINMLSTHVKWLQYVEKFKNNIITTSVAFNPHDVILGDTFGEFFTEMYGHSGFHLLRSKTNDLVAKYAK